MSDFEAVKAEFLRMGREEDWWATQPAKRRLEAARQRIENPSRALDWKDGSYPVLCSAEYEDGPFHVEVALVHDDSPDLSWIGDFGADWKPGCVETEKDASYNYPRWALPYFYPATDSRNLDWKLMKQILEEELTPADLRIRVTRHGIKLGESWLGGGLYQYGKQDACFDSDDIECYAEEAIEEAQETLKNLCAMPA